MKPTSIKHEEEQPSLDFVFESSHTSNPFINPSPQIVEQMEGAPEQVQPESI